MRQALALLLLLSCVVACTTTNEIIIDEKYSPMANYEADLAECQGYAEQVAMGEKTAKGAASGAVIGGAVGGITDGSEGAARGAGVGAVTGAAKGVNRGEQDRLRVVKNCLRNRGYVILN